MYNFNPWQTQLQDLQKQLTQLQTQMNSPQQQPVLNTNLLQNNTSPQVPIKQQNSVPIVHGNEGAKSLASTLSYSSSIIAMDADDIVFYFIATDANGVPTIIAYDGIKREDSPVKIQEVDYVLKSDYNKLETQVKDLVNVVNGLSKNAQENKITAKGNNK